ncbi:sulfurtransferase TusA family protein [Roseivivax sp. CAU 1753]
MHRAGRAPDRGDRRARGTVAGEIRIDWTAARALPISTGMTHDLDARGLLCPLPVLKTRKRLSALSAGERIAVITDDPAAVVDMPHYCQQSGHRLVESRADGDAMVWVIEKA